MMGPRMNWRLTVFTWLALTSALCGSPTPSLSLEDLTREAELILQGTVLGKSAEQDESGRIYTRVEFQVAEVWKGRLGQDRILIVHSGGVSGRRRLTVTSQVKFDLGEEAVVFLVRNARGEGVCLGMAQGKFRVCQDPVTGERLAIPGLEEAAGTVESSPTNAPARTRLTLADLKRWVSRSQP